MPRHNTGPRLELGPRGLYEIRFTERGRSRRYSTGTADRAAAQKALGEFLLKEGEANSSSAPTVEAVLERWYARHAQHKVTGPFLRRYIDTMIPVFGSTPIDKLRPDQIDGEGGYVERRKKAGCVDGTIRTELAALSAAANWCLRRGEISTKIYVPLPPASPPRDRWLSTAECERLLTTAAARRSDPAVPDRLELFIMLAWKTGARETSIERLEWRHVDLGARTIDYRPYYTTKKKRGALVPIADELLPVLQAELARAETPYVMRHTTRVRTRLYALAKAAGVEDVSPHVFRHSFASQALQAGVSIEKVAQVLGDTITTVERVYGKWRPEALADAVNFGSPKLRSVA